MTDQNFAEQKEALLEGLSGKQRDITGCLLENQHRHMMSEAVGDAGMNQTADFARYDKIFMPMIRRVTPALIAQELIGVQPLTAPVGIVNTLRVNYDPGTDVITNGAISKTEGSGMTVYDQYSFLANGEDDLTGTAVDLTNPNAQTAYLENDGGKEMQLEVIRKSTEAKTRKLQAKWTKEAAQDSQAMHGIDLEQELVAAVSDEIVRELDRELITELTNLAGTIKTFDFAGADGRYAAEKFTAITIGASDMSNQIAIKTKRGGAAWCVTSPNVLVALRNASNGAFVPATGGGDVNVSSTAFAGVLNGSIRVFVDIYQTSDVMIMGYKGNSELDAGIIYSPYIPLMQSGVVIDPKTFDPSIGLMTRYALTKFDQGGNEDLGNGANYYARGTIANLSLGF